MHVDAVLAATDGLELTDRLTAPQAIQEELGVAGTMCMPWAGMESISTGDHSALQQSAERYRGPIEEFAEAIVSKCQ